MFDIKIAETLGAMEKGQQYSREIITFREVSKQELRALINVAIKNAFSFTVSPSEEE